MWCVVDVAVDFDVGVDVALDFESRFKGVDVLIRRMILKLWAAVGSRFELPTGVSNICELSGGQ